MPRGQRRGQQAQGQQTRTNSLQGSAALNLHAWQLFGGEGRHYSYSVGLGEFHAPWTFVCTSNNKEVPKSLNSLELGVRSASADGVGHTQPSISVTRASVSRQNEVGS